MNDPIPHLFDPANARELCALSAQAYQKRAEAENFVFWKEKADTHVLIERRLPLPSGEDRGEGRLPLPLGEGRGEGRSDLIFAFRGTADLRNGLTDLDCELIRVGPFRVHRGFHEAMQAVEADLEASLDQTQPSRLWVTGHSLGGALAKLWALRAAQCGHEVAGVYTFGQPRVGDAAFASCYDSVLKARSFRVVHADDIVPRVPWQLARYRHAGHEVYFPPNYQLSVINDPLIDPCWPRKVLHEIPALVRELGRGRIALLDDHHVSRYLALFTERSAKSDKVGQSRT
jgi:pimeloyl-ACP methyl ester carboxylesterase